MNYLYIFLCLLCILNGYILLAKRIGISDNPVERSSHKKSTVRGGGIIFPTAVFLWVFLFDQPDMYLVSAVVLVGVIGFFDDLFSTSQIIRLIIQSLGVLLMMAEIGIFDNSIFYVVTAFVLITGWINTFNFMDGINGIMALYVLSVLIGVYLFRDTAGNISLSLIYTIGISIIIFGWFNLRINALVFSGDVGSLSMGLILAYFVSSLIIASGRWEFILFFCVYGLDSVITIIQRLVKKENIFKAHRSHLYQYLANEFMWPHILVAFIYSFIQLLIIIGLYFLDSDYWSIYSLVVFSSLTIVYTVSKLYIVSYIDKNRMV